MLLMQYKDHEVRSVNKFCTTTPYVDFLRFKEITTFNYYISYL